MVFMMIVPMGSAKNGGEGHKVGELSSAVIFDLTAYPEPKTLTREELKQLVKSYRSTVALAHFLGCSQAFVWERLNPYRRTPLKKSKKFKKGVK